MTSHYVRIINAVLQPARRKPHAALDLFSGCGGLALGFEARGFVTIGYEKNGDAIRTYIQNLQGECTKIILTSRTPLPMARVVIAGLPCQPFSVVGAQNGRSDSRNGFPIFISAIKRLQPDIWLFENVRGLASSYRGYLLEVVRNLRNLGYIVESRVLNAADYGVPQRRERLIVVGHRGQFNFPEPLARVVTAGQAIGETARLAPTASKLLSRRQDRYIRKYERASFCIVPRDLNMNAPSRTLTCRNLGGVTGDMMRVRLPSGRRRQLLVREAARLQSFPDWFEFSGTTASRFHQIGNAVPPLLAFYLAGSVREYLESPYRCSPDQINAWNRELKKPDSLDILARLPGRPRG